MKLLNLICIRNKKEKKVLLGLKKRGFGKDKWNGFGGKVETENKETIMTSVIRELKEESGLTVQPSDLHFQALIRFLYHPSPVTLVVHFFSCEVYSG